MHILAKASTRVRHFGPPTPGYRDECFAHCRERLAEQVRTAATVFAERTAPREPVIPEAPRPSLAANCSDEWLFLQSTRTHHSPIGPHPRPAHWRFRSPWLLIRKSRRVFASMSSPLKTAGPFHRRCAIASVVERARQSTAAVNRMAARRRFQTVRIGLRQ